MENLQRCPKCFLAPDLWTDINHGVTQYVYECPRHGHMAVGPTLELVTSNWNTYIALLLKVA